GFERHQRVVDDNDPCLVADTTHDGTHDRKIVVTVDPGHAETYRRGNHGAIADRFLHDAVKNFFNLEFADGLEVRAACPSRGDNVALFVREQTHRLRAARVDPDYVGHEVMIRIVPRCRDPVPGARRAFF